MERVYPHMVFNPGTGAANDSAHPRWFCARAEDDKPDHHGDPGVGHAMLGPGSVALGAITDDVGSFHLKRDRRRRAVQNAP